MESATLYEWKQAMEGLAREDIGPFEQINDFINGISYRDYYDRNFLVMRMIVFDSGQHNLVANKSDEVKQKFKIKKEIKDATSYIYIPTEEELEQWNELENIENSDVASEEIAKREGGL